MEINGIDLSNLPSEVRPTIVVPKVTPGRVLHIDADFLAYQVSYDDEKGLPDMKHNCDVAIEKLRLMSGAEHAQLHLTPKQSDKGGRYEIALLKEYQGNRKDKPKPKFLAHMRAWMHQERGAIMHLTKEADDGIAMAQYLAIAKGDQNLSIIATKDKDLCMIPGLAVNWDTGQITDTGTKPFGSLWLDDNKKQKKLRGRGTAFFWAQMLMGDAADNISGLPKVVSAPWAMKAPKSVGPVMAYDILGNVKNNRDAFNIVRTLYKETGDVLGYINYRDGSSVPFGKAFQSEAQLTWMRRNDNPNDALEWMREECL